MRLDQAEHGLHGDQRVGGVAAGAQNVEAGLGGERMGGDDHLVLCHRRPGRLSAAGGFGRNGVGRLLRQGDA